MNGLILFALSIVLVSGLSEKEISMLTMRAIRANLNRRVQPCTSFWGYACGNWSSSYVDNFQLVEERYVLAMIPVLSGNYSKERMKAPRLMQKMSDYFQACTRDQPKVVELPQELRSASSEWTTAVAKLRKYGLNGVFFEETVDVAYNDSLRSVVQLKMPDSSFDVKPTTQFDRELFALRSRYRKEDSKVESWTLLELKQHLPQIKWQNYFNELLETELNETALRLEVSDVDYLRAMGELLQRSNKTQLEEHLCTRLVTLERAARPRTSTAAACINHMRALLPLGMNYIYDQLVYSSRSQDTPQLDEIFGGLRAMFGKYLDANRLQLSAEQLDYVRAKLMGIKLKIGNLPDPVISAEFFDTHYESANFSNTDFQHNLWQALRLRTRLQHAPLLQPAAALDMHSYYVNDDVFEARNAPYFEPERNTLTVPMIFMQFPLYDYRQHSIFRSSLMGFILGHEMSHAFEHEGILYDAAGNESPIGLRIRQLATFQAALKCAQQTRTVSLKERLADFNGLQLAYDTFFGLDHNSQQLVYRPYGFDREFVAPQLFHMNFAQFFCGRLPPAIGHDMDDVRVNEAERNLHQFAIDFKCRQQSAPQSMGCEMWRPIGQ
ncbi:neprilysin [Drosophila sulfurigaster albostrigata]|uniref:neprilysin n=1 Tax=Drosophila sulfurigaster albostrigata TaxID=89887 RepID=UPI002D21AD7F|nr:neprilysin [Drosophila sulfurigaster albostrigata]